MARDALRIDTTRDAPFIPLKISIGLSLQAAEVAGKAILRALGQSPDEIRRQHQKHHLVALLEDARDRLRRHGGVTWARHGDFLSWKPVFDGVVVDTTIADYFDEHFAHGPSAYPRNYFYPDLLTFTGPKPIYAVLVMVDHLIDVAHDVATACASGDES